MYTNTYISTYFQESCVNAVRYLINVILRNRLTYAFKHGAGGAEYEKNKL